MKIKNLIAQNGQDKYYEGKTLNECLQKMAVDRWLCMDDEYRQCCSVTETYNDLKEDKGFFWEIINED